MTRLRLQDALQRRLPFALNYAESSASLVAGSVAQLLTFAILARHLGPEAFGALIVITAITTIAVQFCGLGASEPLVRRVARDHSLYRVFLGHNLLLTLGSAAVLVPVVTTVLAYKVPASPDQTTNLIALVIFAASNTLLLRIILLVEQVFIAHQKMRAANLVTLGFGLARLATASIACFVFAVGDLATWAWWHGGMHAFVACLALASLRPFGSPKWHIVREELTQGFYFMIGFGGWALRQNIDVLVLNLVASPAIVATYGIARRITDTSYLTINALNRITYPQLSIAMERGLTHGLDRVKMFTSFAVVIATVTAIAVALLAPLLPWLFGDDYTGAVGLLQSMCWLLIPYALSAAAAEALGASANHGLRASIMNLSIIGSAIIGVMTYMFLMPGTIAALYIAEILIAIAFWLSVRHVVRRERSRDLQAGASTTTTQRGDSKVAPTW